MCVKKIDKSIKPIIDEFNRINEKGWISGINDTSFGNVGITFERELGKKPDCMYLPDYYGIEIKCTTVNSSYPLYLFTAAFDGPNSFEIDRIVKNYGNYDSVYRNMKTLFTKVSFTEKTLVDGKWYFQFTLEDDRIYLNIFDKNGSLIEKKSFIYTKTLYDHIMVKLQRIAVIYAMQKRVRGKKFYKYYKIDVYKFKNFGKFMYLLTHDYINVNITSRISKSGKVAGTYNNNNLVFNINKDRIYFLFDRMYYYNSNTGKEIIK